jgi:outer membrane lipoprotein SlyB
MAFETHQEHEVVDLALENVEASAAVAVTVVGVAVEKAVMEVEAVEVAVKKEEEM